MRAVRMLLGAVVLAAPLVAQRERLELPGDKDPNDWQAYYEVGFRLMATRPDKAEQYFIRAAQLEPSAAETYVARFAAWWAARPRLWELWVQDDEIALADSGAQAAERWLDQAYLINPFVQPTMLMLASPGWTRHPPDDAYWRGIAKYIQGKWPESIREFTRLLRRNSDRWSAHYWRALSHVQLGNLDSATGDLQTMLDSIGRYEETHTLHGTLGAADLYYTLGLVRLRARDHAGAKAALEQTFVRDLAYYMGHFHYGFLLLQEGDTTGAIREYALATEVNPNDEVLRFNYGTVLLQVGRADSAAAQFAAAVRVNPDYAPPYFNGALALERAGHVVEARSWYEDFISRAPQRMDQQIAIARQRLAP
jgi:tetratricopeptide (TPR) repeat protein